MARELMPSRDSVAVLGLGAMGSRIATRLLDSGRRVVVWNRTREKSEELRRRGAETAQTPALAVASVAVAVTMLADPDALLAVVQGPDGIAEALRPDQTLVEMSTVGPSAVMRVRDAVTAGVSVVDAPVLGSIDEAEAGSLVIFVGATEDDATRLHPLLTELGQPLHVGPPGAGAAAKLVANSTLFGSLAVLGEALSLADRLGLERDVVFDVLSRTPIAGQAERRRAALASSSYPRRFGLSLARKDAALVAEEGARAGTDLRVAQAALSWLTAAEAGGAGNSDYTALLETILKQRHSDDTTSRIREAAAANAPRSGRARMIADQIRTDGGYRWVGLYDVTARNVEIVAWSGPGPPAHPRFARGYGLTGRTISCGETVIVNDVRSDPDYLEAFGDTRAEAIVPVLRDGAVVGTIDVESRRPGAFGETDRDFLEKCRDAARALWGETAATAS
jgi:3-hydroxyisobutyrate dehydrogenase-like beta-hydroxyacid dehydrogenase/putative methionine-R-sulfoxide reductase with GAF domain